MRNPIISTLKALAILLVVLSQTGVPAWLLDGVRMCAIPAFFICAGWCFKPQYLGDERTFVAHRFKGLYLPFVLWSLVFLLLHNVFHFCGILSTNYGDALGRVSLPYTFSEVSERFWAIVFNLCGYDAFLGSPFWFFRALLFASLAFLLLLKLFSRGKSGTDSLKRAGWGVLLVAFFLLLWLKVSKAQVFAPAFGGARELWGLFLMACGFLLSQYRVLERLLSWKVALGALVWVVAAVVFSPTPMLSPLSYRALFLLPVSALAGFLLLAYLSAKVCRKEGFLKKSCVYLGDRTLYVFVFHVLAFKLVSVVKVFCYGLPWEAIGGYPYVREVGQNLLFVVLYLLVGVSLPLACRELWLHYSPKLRLRVSSQGVLSVSVAALGGVMLALVWMGKMVVRIGRAVGSFALGCWRAFLAGIKAIVDASSTKEE